MATTVYNTAWIAWAPVLAVVITIVGGGLTLAWSLGGNFERLGAAIERNAEAIDRNAEAIDRNATAMAQVQESVAANAAAIAKLTGEFAEHTRRYDRLAGR